MCRSAGSTVGYCPGSGNVATDPLECARAVFHLLIMRSVRGRVEIGQAAAHRHVKKRSKTSTRSSQMDFVDAFSSHRARNPFLPRLADDKWKAGAGAFGRLPHALMLARLLTVAVDAPARPAHQPLDMDSLVWLEAFLAVPGGLIVVSHDRDFLNRRPLSPPNCSGRDDGVQRPYDAYMVYKEARDKSEESTCNIERQIAQKSGSSSGRQGDKGVAGAVADKIRRRPQGAAAEIPRCEVDPLQVPSPGPSGGVPFKLEKFPYRITTRLFSKKST